MTSLQYRVFPAACRIFFAGACAIAIWYSWILGRADHLFRQDTQDSLRAAIAIEPDAWRFSMRLAALDDDHAQQLLENVLALDPYNAQADIELGLRFEAAGNYSRAEILLLNAFAMDRTFLPRWTLANFYLRRDNMPAFWLWARRTAEMPSDNTGPLFELCWRASPDASHITRILLNHNPDLIRQYLAFLLAKNQFPEATEIAQRLAQFGDPHRDRPLMFSAIDQMIAANDANQAYSLWNALIDSHWVAADRSTPNNPNFAREPLPVGFDWTLNSYSGLHSWPGPSGLETEFTGRQPEDCTVADQTLVLPPGIYELEYSYHTEGIAPATGLRWQILAAGGGQPFAQSADLSSDAPNRTKLALTIPPGTPLLHLRLQYRRALGTPRVSGILVTSSVQIHPR